MSTSNNNNGNNNNKDDRIVRKKAHSNSSEQHDDDTGAESTTRVGAVQQGFRGLRKNSKAHKSGSNKSQQRQQQPVDVQRNGIITFWGSRKKPQQKQPQQQLPAVTICNSNNNIDGLSASHQHALEEQSRLFTCQQQLQQTDGESILLPDEQERHESVDMVETNSSIAGIPSHPPHTSRSNDVNYDQERLAEAMPVPDDEIIYAQAQEVLDPASQGATRMASMAESTRQKAEQRKRIGCIVLLVVIAICLLTNIIAVGTYFGTRSDRSSPTRIGPEVPPKTSTPTATSAPTTMMQQYPFLIDFWRHLPNYTWQSLQLPTSPQSRALEWFIDNYDDLLEYQNLTYLPLWRQKQVFALATFYFATNGPEWSPKMIREDWLQFKSECVWFSRSFGYLETEHIFNGSQYEGYAFTGQFVPVEDNDSSNHSDSSSNSNNSSSSNICDANGKFLNLNISLDSSGNQMGAVIPPELAMVSTLANIRLSGFNSSGSSSIWFVPTELAQLQHLTTLYLRFNDGLGQLPSELGMFSQLQELDLSSTDSSGTIPTEFGSLTQLTKLNLGSAFSISGTIPSQLGRMTNLRHLDFYDLGLSGTIPSEVGSFTRLTAFSLTNNMLTGVVPTEIGAWRELRYFYINSNRNISGTIPSELGLWRNAKFVQMGGLSLEGDIPSELGLMADIEDVGLCYNGLTGLLPTQLGGLSLLRDLSLCSNAIFGSIPTEFGLLQRLYSLYLDDNRLSGKLPSELGVLSNLTHLEVQDNLLSGRLPSELGTMTSLAGCRLQDNLISSVPPTTPSSCYLFGNNASLYIAPDGVHDYITEINLPGVWWEIEGGLHGSIPTMIGRLSNLEKINLRNNDLTGPLPSELGLCTKLTQVDVSSNVPLTGSLPTELGLLTRLESLLLSSNGLTGTLFSELGLLTNLESLWLYDNMLYGAIPSDIGRLSSLETFNIHSNGLSGAIPLQIGLTSNVTNIRFQGNAFSGALPSGLWKLSKLVVLDLSDLPLLTGYIPKDVSLLTSLGFLNISGSSIVGRLPDDLCGLQNTSCSYTLWDWNYPCDFSFDCHDDGLLCGCDCVCLNESKV